MSIALVKYLTTKPKDLINVIPSYIRVCTIHTSAEVLVLVLGVELEQNLMVVL